MKNIKYLAVSILLIPVLAGAHGLEVVLPSAGLTPESPFYFLDRFGENLQEFFTFNSETKAKLQIEFAGERIAEIKIMIEEKGVHTEGIDKAKLLLLANVAYAAEIINQEKSSGKDVTALAKDIDDQFDAREKLLTQTFLDARAKLLAERMSIKNKLLVEAQTAGDAARVAELTQQLSDLQEQINDLGEKKDEIKNSLREQKKDIEENMDIEDQDEDQTDQDIDDDEEQNQEDDQDEFEQNEEKESEELEESEDRDGHSETETEHEDDHDKSEQNQEKDND